MPVPVDTWDSITVGPTQTFKLGFLRATGTGYAAGVSLRQRTDTTSIFESRRHAPRAIPFAVTPGSAATVNVQWEEDANELFTPFKPARTLAGTWNGVTVSAEAEVTAFDPMPDASDGTKVKGFTGSFLFKDPIWRSTTTQTDSASPLTAGGNYFAQPTLTFTPSGTTVRRRRVTVEDQTNRGLGAFTVMCQFSTTGVGADDSSHFRVYFEGRDVPFYVVPDTENTIATRIFFALDVGARATVNVDIYYGPDIDNTITSQLFHPRGFDLDSSTWENTNWEWTSAFLAPDANPQACGSWKQAHTGSEIASVRYQITTQAITALQIDWSQVPPVKQWVTVGTSIGISISTTNQYDNSGDSLVMAIGATAGDTDALSGLSRDLDLTSVTAGSARAYIRKRTPGAGSWLDCWTTTADSTTTTAVDCDGATGLSVGIEPATSNFAGTAVLNLAISGTFALIISEDSTPDITIDDAVTAYLISGTFENETTGDTITFGGTDENGVLIDDTTLIIDCLAQTITQGDEDTPRYGGIGFSNQALWMRLQPGSNAWSDADGAAAFVSWKDAYVV